MRDDNRFGSYDHPYRPTGEGSDPTPKNSGEYHKGDEPFQFPWWAILLGFITWWPLGFIFLMLNSAMEKGALRPYQQSRPTSAPRTAASQPIYAQNKPSPMQAKTPQPSVKQDPKQTSKQAPKQDKEQTVFTVMTIAGICLAAVGLLTLPESLSLLSYLFTDGIGTSGWVLEELFGTVGFLAGGLGCLWAAGKLRTNRRLRKKIANIVGDAKYMYIDDIAGAIPCSYEKCCKHLENCIEAGIFGDNAYLDMRTRCLIVSGPAPADKTAAPKAAPEKPAAAPSGDKYQQILDDLHRVNNAIPDEVMTDKIARLETVSAKIFEQAKSDPGKLPRMRKFMDYYLPTSLKLLKTYAELDAQGVEGENISDSKRRIEQTMDTLVVAFENQLDQLFSNDALDVSADIDVMQNMLRADGLTGTDPFKADPAPKAPDVPHLEL